MAKKDKVKELKRESRFAAMEALRPTGGFPVPPREAISQAKKVSKKLPYPIAPYPQANPLQLFRWAQHEWWQLGRWRGLALPVVAIVALLTWEKEQALKEERWHEIEMAQTRRRAAELYGAFGPRPHKKKLLGIIPLPGR